MKPNLTNKEKEIVQSLIEGKSNQSIADDLGISINTVKTHLKSVFQKMEVHSRQQLIVKVLT